MAVIGLITNGYVLYQASSGRARTQGRGFLLARYAAAKTIRAWVRTGIHVTNLALGVVSLFAIPMAGTGQTLNAVLFAIAVLVGLYVVHVLVVLDGMIEAYAIYRA